MSRRLAVVRWALCAAAASSTVAVAQAPPSSVEGRVAVYADDDDTTVWRPNVGGTATAGEVAVDASWTADVVSSASIDVVTRASQRVRETRHEAGLGVSWYGADALQLGLAYTFGYEPDFQSHAVSLRAQRDLGDERLWHGAAGLSVGTSRIGTVVDESFSEHAETVQLALSLSRITSPATVLRAALEGAAVLGYQASPYRTVRLGDWEARPYAGDDPDAPVWIFTGVSAVARERHPDGRLRARLVLDGVHAVGERLALYAALAGYGDDWGLAALDARGELRWEPEHGLLLRFGARAYLQGGARFWRRRYDENAADGLLTDDKELGPMRSWSLWVGASVPAGPVVLETRVEGTRYEYRGFDLLPHKHALAIQLACRWEP